MTDDTNNDNEFLGEHGQVFTRPTQDDPMSFRAHPGKRGTPFPSIRTPPSSSFCPYCHDFLHLPWSPMTNCRNSTPTDAVVVSQLQHEPTQGGRRTVCVHVQVYISEMERRRSYECFLHRNNTYPTPPASKDNTIRRTQANNKVIRRTSTKLPADKVKNVDHNRQAKLRDFLMTAMGPTTQVERFIRAAHFKWSPGSTSDECRTKNVKQIAVKTYQAATKFATLEIILDACADTSVLQLTESLEGVSNNQKYANPQGTMVDNPQFLDLSRACQDDDQDDESTKQPQRVDSYCYAGTCRPISGYGM